MVYCIRNKRCNNKLQATTRSNMADAVDPTTGCAKIKFTSTNEIERALPNLLADHHGGSSDKIMSVQSWNTFCDKVDDATNALRRVNTIQCIGWCLLLADFLLVPLMLWRAYVDDEDYSTLYIIIMLVLILLMIPLINFVSEVKVDVMAEAEVVAVSSAVAVPAKASFE